MKPITKRVFIKLTVGLVVLVVLGLVFVMNKEVRIEDALEIAYSQSTNQPAQMTFSLTNRSEHSILIWAIIERRTDAGWPQYSIGTVLSEVGKKNDIEAHKTRNLSITPPKQPTRWRLRIYYVKGVTKTERAVKFVSDTLKQLNLAWLLPKKSNSEELCTIVSKEM